MGSKKQTQIKAETAKKNPNLSSNSNSNGSTYLKWRNQKFASETATNLQAAVMWLKGGGCDLVELLKAEAGLQEAAL